MQVNVQAEVLHFNQQIVFFFQIVLFKEYLKLKEKNAIFCADCIAFFSLIACLPLDFSQCAWLWDFVPLDLLDSALPSGRC